jgi:hypothetical protein
MQTALVTITTAIAIVLIHLSYVDFRFRYRDGILWFWLLNPAPPLMWIARATVVLALLVALAGPFIGIGETYALALAILMGAHIVTLILLEVLEPR